MQISEQHLNIVTDLIPFAGEYRLGLHSSLGGGEIWAWDDNNACLDRASYRRKLTWECR